MPPAGGQRQLRWHIVRPDRGPFRRGKGTLCGRPWAHADGRDGYKTRPTVAVVQSGQFGLDQAILAVTAAV